MSSLLSLRGMCFGGGSRFNSYGLNMKTEDSIFVVLIDERMSVEGPEHCGRIIVRSLLAVMRAKRLAHFARKIHYAGVSHWFVSYCFLLFGGRFWATEQMRNSHMLI